MANTRTFTRDELFDLDIPYSDDTVHTEHVDSGRWNETRTAVFKHDGTHWRVTYQVGLTEMQDCDRWLYQDVISAVEVRPVEVTRMVTTTEWQPVPAAEPATS
ncbi:hypothetical protein [Glutamicibacter sp. V16R2B1]|uniref:hypothetical protein n=1 Tax=Glutamicibacter sp. V16R2B1 TaxID=2036207 RepID=UPI0010FD7EE7|nr:hypothetical protein [Glutamicibacter sp. V16R2B1]MCK9901331.1 hypothetical protein [Frankia sp. Cpl3]TLK47817.1 hypothetical protein FDN03_15655 [Glutamicibacter sp. V16R2B1]